MLITPCMNGVPGREVKSETLRKLSKMTHPGTGRAGIQIQFCDAMAHAFLVGAPQEESYLDFSYLNTGDP